MRKMRVLILVLAVAFIFALAYSPPTQAKTSELNDETMIVGDTNPAPQIAAANISQPTDSPTESFVAAINVQQGTSNVYHRALWVDKSPSTSTSSRRYVGRLPGARARPADNYVGGNVRANHFVLKV